MKAPELLSLRRLTAWYRPEQPVLSGLSLDLKEGEAVGLIGLNGAGKTTLLRILAGLLSSFQLDAALWEGRPFSFRDREFKRNRFIVFAEDSSFSYFTFREYLAYAAASYGKPLPDPEPLVQGFHFEAYTDVLLKELSSGNRKKAYLIAAFALEPRLLLLDEPFNALDFQSTEFLYRLINGYKGCGTVLFSSHILESICLTADRVLVLEQGIISRAFAGKEILPETIRDELSAYDAQERSCL